MPITWCNPRDSFIFTIGQSSSTPSFHRPSSTSVLYSVEAASHCLSTPQYTNSERTLESEFSKVRLTCEVA